MRFCSSPLTCKKFLSPSWLLELWSGFRWVNEGSVGGSGLQLEAKARVVEDELLELFVASRESSIGGREGKLESGLRAMLLLLR